MPCSCSRARRQEDGAPLQFLRGVSSLTERDACFFTVPGKVKAPGGAHLAAGRAKGVQFWPKPRGGAGTSACCHPLLTEHTVGALEPLCPLGKLN